MSVLGREPREPRARGPRVDYSMRAFEGLFVEATPERLEKPKRVKAECVVKPRVAPPRPQAELSDESLKALRTLIQVFMRSGAPLVEYLYLAPKADLERFVDFVTHDGVTNSFADLTSRPKCDTCFQGWKVCRRAQNNFQYFQATGLSMKECHSWPKHGFTFKGRGHCAYIFLRCGDKPWAADSCLDFIARVKAVAGLAG